MKEEELEELLPGEELEELIELELEEEELELEEELDEELEELEELEDELVELELEEDSTHSQSGASYSALISQSNGAVLQTNVLSFLKVTQVNSQFPLGPTTNGS